MTTYADSSALVKLYADEPGTDIVRALRGVVISCIARVEVPAALWRKFRLGEIDAAATQALVGEFESHYHGSGDEPPLFVALALRAALLSEAARLVATHELRAYDALQLASARAAREADPECASFACFDEELRTAAGAEGFALVPGAFP